MWTLMAHAGPAYGPQYPPLADDETMQNVICVVELDWDKTPHYPYYRYMRIKILVPVRSALHFGFGVGFKRELVCRRWRDTFLR